MPTSTPGAAGPSPTAAPPPIRERRPARWPRLAMRTLAGIAAAAVLGAVFLLYTRPAFMVTLIDQVWSCF